MRKFLLLTLILLVSVFSFTALAAEGPELDDDELEIVVPESADRYVASVTINSTGDGLEVGEYQLLTNDLDLTGLYYVAKDENGTDKVLDYVYGEYSDRFNLGSMEEITHSKGNYEMYKMKSSTEWIPGTWTGEGLTTSIRDFRYEVFKYHLIPYASIGAGYAEKLYAYGHDKAETLALYEANFGADSSVYSTIVNYYGSLDANGIADALLENQTYAKSKFESNVVRYAFEPDEIVAVDEMKTYNFTSWKQQGGVWVESNIYAKATFFVAGTDGKVTSHTWTSEAFNANANGYSVKHSVDVQSIEGLPTEGWIIGIELRPFAVIEDVTKISGEFYNKTSTTQNTRFLNTQFMPAIYPDEYVITEQQETPELRYDYVGGKFIITIENAEAGVTYAYRSELSEWTEIEAGKNSFEVANGYWFVKAMGTDEIIDSAVAKLNIAGLFPKPELTLGEGNTITAPDNDMSYEYAKLSFNTEPVYEPLTEATLTAGVWAVRAASDGTLAASDPQYFYIEGEDAGTVIFATTSGTSFTAGRWVGTKGSATLFDFGKAWGKTPTAFGNTNFEIYYQLTTSIFTNKTYMNYGYRYLFRDSEIVPVSTLKNVTVSGINTTKIYYDLDGTKTEIKKGKTLARVYVVGADVPYYDVLTDATYHTVLGMDLSQLSDKEGWVVAIEYFPFYQPLDANGNAVESPYISAAASFAIRFAPLVMDETVDLAPTGNSHTGIAADGRHRYSLTIADKAATPTLSIEKAGDKFIIKVSNAVEGYTYQYKSEASGWITLAAGETSFAVDTAGTYYVKSVASGTLLGSDAASVSFEGVKDTPNLKPDANNVITAPEGETYQLAQLGYGVTPVYETFTTATLTPGLWAVKALGNGTTVFDSETQIIFVAGDGTGKIDFAVKLGSTEFTKGLWTGVLGGATLFDWDYYNNADMIFTTNHIEIYAAFTNSFITNGTYKDFGYRYILKDNEILPLSELVDLSATRKNFSNITCDGAVVDYTKTRARVHVAGGDVAYYDVITLCNFTSAPGFVFELSQLNDKKGYVTAIELYLHHEFTDINGNKLNGTLSTANSTSYGITFANLSINEGVELANKNTGNTGLSADGKSLYSLRIANDLRAPKFEALEDNPNGLRITNYIEGARYAWSTAVNGVWTEFEGDTVEFTAFGTYYIKLVGDENYPEIINVNPFTTADIVLEGTSLVLDGAIGIKVYFGANKGVEYTASYKVVDKTNGATVYEDAEAEVIKSTEGNLYFVVPVYPKDADKLEVYVTVKNNADGTSHSATTSVPYYIETLKSMAENGDEACLAALGVVEAVEAYTAYAKNYFYKSTESALPNISATLGDITAPEIIDNVAGAKYFGTSLLLDGKTTLRHYFEITDPVGFDRNVAYLNEEIINEGVITDNNGTTLVYYDIADIPAHKLNNKYTLEIYGSDNAVSGKITYSVTNYIEKQINSEDTRMANLMKALYNYYEESDEYSEIAQNQGQRAEIWAAMTLAKETTPAWKEVPAYAPTKEGYTHIKAITYDGFEYKGGKTKIFAYVGFPEGASADSPVPAVVLVHGGGGHPYAHWVKLWNDRGYAAIAMETTGAFPAAGTVTYTESENSNFTYGISGDFVEEGYVSAPSRSYPTTYTPVSEQWAYHGLSQVILAGNILRADARVDADNIGITGVSWGGTMTSQVIGYDNRFSFAIPVYGTAYLGSEMHTFSNFNNEYVNSLWGAERNLDNADMPTFWFAYNDDNNFCVPAYYKSYMHTASLNDKNALLMLGNWSHSHGSVFNKKHSFWFADWVTFGTGGFVTFEDQPKSANVNCKLNIPEGVTGDITAKVHYITEPMSYSVFAKFGTNAYKYLDQYWQTNTTCLTVDRATSTVSGTVPADAAGFYINVVYTLEGSTCETSSIYIPVDKASTPEDESEWIWK